MGIEHGIFYASYIFRAGTGVVMKVILQETVQKLGKAGEVVEAKRGYFRNFLEPRHLAVLATKGTMKKRDEDMEALRKKAQKAHDEAVKLAESITNLPILKMTAKAGDGGKLYGKITSKEVAELIEKSVGAPINKRDLKISGDINVIGSYSVLVKLTSEVQAKCELEVEPEGGRPVVQESSEAKA